MSVTRLIVPGATIDTGEILVPPHAAHHAQVARVAQGDPIEVLDLAGTVGVGRLLRWEGGACRVEVDVITTGRGEPPDNPQSVR